ncbi:hypothetical protein Nepgr_027309 [Nepenthes gracilis]|uniref:Uncharacterized protein n=1 Tax=Nepenthes gracilis TaxID=150966 RepID=A0AAD3TAA5_NEPGR|nr:hypothetical protein Nepgr_027309 [Nepenthes gracilis]
MGWSCCSPRVEEVPQLVGLVACWPFRGSSGPTRSSSPRGILPLEATWVLGNSCRVGALDGRSRLLPPLQDVSAWEPLEGAPFTFLSSLAQRVRRTLDMSSTFVAKPLTTGSGWFSMLRHVGVFDKLQTSAAIGHAVSEMSVCGVSLEVTRHALGIVTDSGGV